MLLSLGPDGLGFPDFKASAGKNKKGKKPGEDGGREVGFVPLECWTASFFKIEIGSHYVARDGLQLIAIFLPQPPVLGLGS